MRLSVFPDLSTKDGVTNENARMTNALKEVRAIGDMVNIRPGLVTFVTYAGNGNGLVDFNGTLLALYGTNFVIPANGEFISTSLPSNSPWRVITSPNKFVIFATSATSVAASSDGISWTNGTLPSASNWSSGAWNGTVFAIISDNSLNAATSTDGLSWISRAIPVSTAWDGGLVWNGTIFCALSNFNAMTSLDGITWNNAIVTAPDVGSWVGLCWNGSKFCAVASEDTLTSTDGVTWVKHSVVMPSRILWRDTASNGEVFCAIAYNSNKVAVSVDGINWSENTLPSISEWFGITWNGFYFYAIAVNSNNAARSKDGIIWESMNTPIVGNWAFIESSNGGVLATPYSGAIGQLIKSTVIATLQDKTFDFVQSPI